MSAACGQVEAKCFGAGQIDDKIELGRLLDRDIARFFHPKGRMFSSWQLTRRVS
jgi:hypothetical protein